MHVHHYHPPPPTNDIYWTKEEIQKQINYNKHKLIILLLPHQHQLWPILPYKYQLYVSSDQQAFLEDVISQTFSLLFENALSTLTSILISSKAGMSDAKTFVQTKKFKNKIKTHIFILLNF